MSRRGGVGLGLGVERSAEQSGIVGDVLALRDALFAVAALTAACQQSETRQEFICAPGSMFECECADLQRSLQYCNETGTAWGPCACGDDADGGADGDADGDGDGDADGDADPIGALDRWRDAQTERASTCCAEVAEGTSLVDDTYDDLVALVDSEGVTISESLVDDCISDVASASCVTWQYWKGSLPGPCWTFYSGTAARGDACDSDYVCEPEMLCVLQDQAYTCQSAPDLGRTCLSGCRRGLICRSDFMCVRPGDLGDSCDDDSECGSAVCRGDPGECVASFCAGNTFN